jgi:hypothetical protein
MFSKHTSQAVLSAVLSGFLLSACGGGSGSDSQSSTTPNSNINSQQQTYAEIAGTAFSNKPLSDVKVNAICKDGSGFHADVVTDQEGQWKGEVDASQFPCRIEVQADRKYYGYAQKAGNVNLNPLTTIVLTSATGMLPSTWYTAGTEIELSRLQTSVQNLIIELKQEGYSIDESRDLFNVISNLNTAEFKVVQELLAAIGANPNIEDLEALLLLIKDGNIGQIPKNTTTNFVVPEAWNIHLDACVPEKIESSNMLLYGMCTKAVIKDFETTDLVHDQSSASCSLHKENDTITLTQGTRSLSVKIDQEQQDGVTINLNGVYNYSGPVYTLQISTGIYDLNYNFNQGLFQFSNTGKLIVAYIKGPSGEIRCYQPDLKKLIEQYS